MKLRLPIVILGIVSHLSCFAEQKQEAPMPPARWSQEKAKAWYDRQPWMVGCNFIPSTAINQLEMWQEDTFDPTTIERELKWASELGFNTIRVYLHDLAWEADADGFKKRVGQFLACAQRYGIRSILVLFDDCWNANPKAGKQPEPQTGVHNSGWLQSPGRDVVNSPESWPRLERYVKDVIGTFAKDERVVMWDLYNEPGNEKQGVKSLPLLVKAFQWAREANPTQPLTAGVWCDDKTLNAFQEAASDIITFHNYNDLKNLTEQISNLKRHGRPVVCTEWLLRGKSDVVTHLPLFKRERVGCFNWGFVAGKTQTIYPWGSPKGAPEPKIWFHDLLRSDGTPFSADEADLFKKLTAVAVAGGEKISSPAEIRYPSDTIMSLDELAGDWMEVNTLRNFPSVNNFWGALKTHPNLTTFLYATFPPYANGGDSGVLSMNGKPVTATGSRWYPYQVLRRATVDGVEMESGIRMPFEQRGVFCRLTLKNATTKSQTVDVSWAFSGQVCRHPDAAWATWSSPHGAVGSMVTLTGADAKVLSAVGNKGSEPAAIAFAFSPEPADLKAMPDGGVAAWKISLAPGQTASLAYTSAMDKEPAAATELATRWAESFDQSFELAKTQWEDRWQATFTPGNKHFSGHLPTLLTDDLKIRRVYYQGVLAALMLCRTDLPAAKRCFVTAGPQWAVTLMYFWDTEMWANAWAMLEPATMKELLTKWLAMDHHGCYALDCLSGKGAGPWYAANDWSIFRCVDAYLGVTGDKAFLNQVINGKTVLQRLEDMATFYEKRPLTKDSLLADYGGADNLLECSVRYVEGVASLNAANVYMLRRVADYCEQSGNTARAQALRAKADKLFPFVMALYKPGEGVWNARDKAGKEVSSRHCFDYIMTGQALENDLTPTMKTEMTGFVERELLTKTWMRAMSLKDPAAARSDRPDHGPMGSYDGWPPLTMDVMCRFGTFDKAVNFLRAVEPVTREGSFAQSHEFLGPDSRGFDPLVRIANRGGQDFNAGCGAAFAEVIIRSFLGYRPDLPGEGLPLLAPSTPRGFNGQLRHVPFHGKLYTITSDGKGIRQKKE